MNIGEANAVHEVTDWLTSLVFFEVHPDCLVDDATLLRSVRFLAERARKALDAGPLPEAVHARMAVLLQSITETTRGDL